MNNQKKNTSNALLAYEKIKHMILTGEKTANSRLIPADLEQEIGIGRVPIREALIQLDRTGLVVNVPYKGAVVGAPPTIEEIEEIFLLKITLEPKLAAHGLEKMDEVHLIAIRKAHQQMCSSKTRSENYFSLNKQFHFSLYEPSGMHHLCLIADKISQSVEAFRILYNFAERDFEKFNSDHEKILEQIEKGDVIALKKELTNNLISGRDTLLEAYKRINTFLHGR